MTQRSPQQRKAMEVYFRELAEALNAAGYDMKKVLEVKTVDVPWSQELVKEVLWKSIQEPMYPETVDEDGVVHTARCPMDGVDKVYEVLNRHIASNFGVSIPFPSHEEQLNDSLIKQSKGEK